LYMEYQFPISPYCYILYTRITKFWQDNAVGRKQTCLIEHLRQSIMPLMLLVVCSASRFGCFILVKTVYIGMILELSGPELRYMLSWKFFGVQVKNRWERESQPTFLSADFQSNLSAICEAHGWKVHNDCFQVRAWVSQVTASSSMAFMTCKKGQLLLW
jgi:hypothetical protein